MPCNSCGGSSRMTAPMMQQSIVNGVPVTETSAPTVPVAYIGARAGTMTYVVNGRSYRAGANSFHRIVNVLAEDVDLFLSKFIGEFIPFVVAPDPASAPAPDLAFAPAPDLVVPLGSAAPAIGEDNLALSVYPVPIEANSVSAEVPAYDFHKLGLTIKQARTLVDTHQITTLELFIENAPRIAFFLGCSPDKVTGWVQKARSELNA